MGTYTPWGLKNKTIIKHTTTITEVKIDHTKRQSLTHKAPPEPPQPYTEFLCGSEGLIGPPLPRLHAKNIPAIEHMLYGQRHQYICLVLAKCVSNFVTA